MVYVFHCAEVFSFNCHMQGSYQMRINSQNQFWYYAKFGQGYIFSIYLYNSRNEGNSNSYQLYVLTYSFYIFDADVSSFLSNKFHK